MSKALILFLYGASLWITISRWYGAGNSGMPDPQVIAPASYLFGILALSADFLEGLPVVLALGLTFILWEKSPPTKASAKTTNVAAKPATSSLKLGAAAVKKQEGVSK